MVECIKRILTQNFKLNNDYETSKTNKKYRVWRAAIICLTGIGRMRTAKARSKAEPQKDKGTSEEQQKFYDVKPAAIRWLY
jgi:hypothetical protein